MEIASLKNPNKSHRKNIDIPEDSVQLAELMGILFGDGGINNYWQIVISLNSISDLVYADYVILLLEDLFKIDVAIRKRPGQNTLVLVCSSTNLVDFLVQKGAVRGNKVLQALNVPGWVLGNIAYKKTFVRGMVDTDGCLFTHKHIIKGKQYQNIGFCFTSYSKPLLLSVANILAEFGIEPHITRDKFRIFLYGEKAIMKYLQIFGSSNPRIYKKYNVWRDARAV